ncbi:hypothetical protein ACIA8I_39980 [Streptomyces rishiriensis]|uniref:hypothetical protein n=1 Tax=Streptomyces rishiriensis TaxID=68264 RepID=UPI00379632E7
MVKLTFHPHTLTAALHAGSHAARTTADTDGHGVAITAQPDGSLRIHSDTGADFSRAYADPAPDTDPGADPQPAAVITLHAAASFRRHLTRCGPQDSVELRITPHAVTLIKNGWLNLAAASNKAPTLSPWAYRDLPTADLATEIPSHLHPARDQLHTDLATHAHPDPDSTLEVYPQAHDPHALVWHLGDWALGLTHTPSR